MLYSMWTPVVKKKNAFSWRKSLGVILFTALYRFYSPIRDESGLQTPLLSSEALPKAQEISLIVLTILTKECGFSIFCPTLPAFGSHPEDDLLYRNEFSNDSLPPEKQD